MDIIGYFEEYYINNKFLGTRKTTEQKRDVGYYGRKKILSDKIIILDNKKVIKPNTLYETIYYPLNGR